MNTEDETERLSSLAADFVKTIGQASDEATDIVYEAGVLVESDPDVGWQLTRLAFEKATTQDEFEFIGAALLEPLIQKFPDTIAERSLAMLRDSPQFLSVLRTAHLTGLPRPIWERINDALAVAGVPHDQLVDWSLITPVDRSESS